MKLLFLTFFEVFALSSIPEKLQLYQKMTGIDDLMLMNILEQSMQGSKLILKHLTINPYPSILREKSETRDHHRARFAEKIQNATLRH